MPTPTSLKPMAVRVASVESELALKRGELVRMANSTSSSATVDEGFPDGVTCDCDHCLEGVPIPDGTECCTSFTKFTLKNPWLSCADADLELLYIGVDQWLTEDFTAPNTNVYNFLLEPDVDGITTLTLKLKTDNGGDPVCIVYGRAGFDCQCNNSLTIKKPYGWWSGVDRTELSCNVCLKPSTALSILEGAIFPMGVCNATLNSVPVSIPVVIDSVDFGYCINTECDYSALNNSTTTCVLTNVTVDSDGVIQLLVYTAKIALPSDVGCTLSYMHFRVQYDLGGCWSIIRIFGGSEDGTEPTNGYNEVMRWVESGGWNPWVLESVILEGSPSAPGCYGYPDATVFWGHDNSGVDGAGVGSTSPSATGACADTCTPDAPPPDSDPGACCFEGECYQWDNALCNDFGGTWYPAQDDCTEQCNPNGVCCVGGFCIDTSNQYECDLYSGTFVAAGTCADCDTSGACCRDGGGCDDDILPGDCSGTGEFHNGPGSVCASVDCTETCCCYNLSGTCIREEISVAECASYAHSQDWPVLCISAPAGCGDGGVDGTPEPDGDCIFF